MQELSLRVELNHLLEAEELYWKQRSRVTWLREGDRNTSFFHISTSNWRRRNSIQWLQSSTGSWTTDKEEIVATVREFYEHLYKSSHPTLPHIEDDKQSQDQSPAIC
uniref:Uncharacterized protein n=1 Tax=Nelumbo nucifera TaxID=4432 RepID=A0A822ZIU9_NELNU|nr:TPA_asm: hypothetical protein HUJ06_003292 [Nelumbo nucifera]